MQMRNVMYTYTKWSLQISFLIISMLFSSIANAQRLNEDGLKMISCIRIGQKDTIYFKYDERNRLKEIVCPFTDFEEQSEETRMNGRLIKRTTQIPIPAKMIFTRVKDSIFQKKYKNGLIDTSSSVSYRWKLNTNNKIKQYVIRFQREENYNELYFDFKYDNNLRLKEVKIYRRYFQLGSLSFSGSFGYYLIRYDRQGYYIDEYSFQLNELELKLPNLIDYINSHTWIGNEPALLENPNAKGYSYSADNRNDTNMNLNSLFAIYSKSIPSGSDLFNYIVLHTEWSGLREDFLATHCKPRYSKENYDIVYKRDLKGNIKTILYCIDGYYKPKDEIIFIDYVDE